MLSSLKDLVAASAAKALLAGRLERYARLDGLHLDSRNQSLRMVLVLAGDDEPVQVAASYRLGVRDGKHFLTLEGMAASRVWLDHLLNDLLAGKPLPVPALAAAALGGVRAAGGVDG